MGNPLLMVIFKIATLNYQRVVFDPYWCETAREADDRVHAIILQGLGRAFCAGSLGVSALPLGLCRSHGFGNWTCWENTRIISTIHWLSTVGFRGRCHGIANTMGRFGSNRIPWNHWSIKSYSISFLYVFSHYSMAMCLDIPQTNRNLTGSVSKVWPQGIFRRFTSGRLGSFTKKKKHLGDPRRKTKWGCNGGQNEDIVMKYYNIYIYI